MSALPKAVAATLEDRLGVPPRAAQPMGGGMINAAARVEIGEETIFVKWRDDAPPGFFEAEVDGLGRLAEVHALRVPNPIVWSDAPAAAVPFLAMEFIETRRSAHSARIGAKFGKGLAELHRRTRTPGGKFGLERDNFIGLLDQRNTPTASWPEFYRDHRLRPQIDLAKHSGRLPPQREAALMAVCERVGDVLPQAVAPCLVHGDLWSGNLLFVGDDSVLVDPAVYRADREVELAYMELFGGFPPGALEAYRQEYPLEKGYERRRPLLQLYPLLVHLNHFGEEYGPHVDRACEPYLR